MNDEITTYLNDHLAGSVAALELIEHLQKRYEGEQLAAFFASLYREIKSDQDVLRQLLGAAETKESVLRKAAAWLAEKLVRSKFKLAGENVGGLGLVQALETIALGIRGKELLWRALAGSTWPPLRGLDLAQLVQKAVDQQARVEEKRIAAAGEAFC